MSTVITVDGNLLRIRPGEHSTLEMSRDNGKSWFAYYTDPNFDRINFRELVACDGYLMAETDKGTFYSNTKGKRWYKNLISNPPKRPSQSNDSDDSSIIMDAASALLRMLKRKRTNKNNDTSEEPTDSEDEVIAKEPFFLPWVGSSALNKGFRGKRIMIVGDSHYCGNCKISSQCGIKRMYSIDEMEDCAYFTIKTIKEYLEARKGNCEKKDWMNTYLRFERVLSGNTETQTSDSIRIWNSLIFTNFIQTAYLKKEEKSKRYTKEDYENSQYAVPMLITEYQPDFIITWGKRADYMTPWDWMPEDNWTSIDEDFGIYNWQGKRIKMLRITHPSSPQFNYEEVKTSISRYIR